MSTAESPTTPSRLTAGMLALLACLGMLWVIDKYFLPHGLPANKDGVWALEVAGVTVFFGSVVLYHLFELMGYVSKAHKGEAQPTFVLIAFSLALTLLGSAAFLLVAMTALK